MRTPSLFRLISALVLAVPFAAVAQEEDPTRTTSQEEEAGDVSEVDKDALGPLRERIRPGSGHLFLKRGRWELSPSASVTFRDAFFRKYVLGATLTYFPTETFGVGIHAGYSIPTVSGAAQLCTFGDDVTQRSCGAPTKQQLDGFAPGQIKMIGGVDVQWAPIYGKISLLSERFVHFDLYGIAGVTGVQYGGKADTSTAATLEAGGVNKFTVGGNVGLGARFVFNSWMALRTEVRDIVYREEPFTDGDSALRNQFMFQLGLSFFLPTALPEAR